MSCVDLPLREIQLLTNDEVIANAVHSSKVVATGEPQNANAIAQVTCQKMYLSLHAYDSAVVEAFYRNSHIPPANKRLRLSISSTKEALHVLGSYRCHSLLAEYEFCLSGPDANPLSIHSFMDEPTFPRLSSIELFGDFHTATESHSYNMDIVRYASNLQSLCCTGNMINAVFSCCSCCLAELSLLVDEAIIPRNILQRLHNKSFCQSVKKLTIIGDTWGNPGFSFALPELLLLKSFSSLRSLELGNVECNEQDFAHVFEFFAAQLDEVHLSHVHGLSPQFYHYLLTAVECTKKVIHIPRGLLHVSALPLTFKRSAPVPNVFCTRTLELKSEYGFLTFPMPEMIIDIMRRGYFANLQELNMNCETISYQDLLVIRDCCSRLESLVIDFNEEDNNSSPTQPCCMIEQFPQPWSHLKEVKLTGHVKVSFTGCTAIASCGQKMRAVTTNSLQHENSAEEYNDKDCLYQQDEICSRFPRIRFCFLSDT